MDPLVQTMMEVKREMCYGNQTFVVAQNEITQVRSPRRELANSQLASRKLVSWELDGPSGFLRRPSNKRPPMMLEV